ncbi:MAG: hypothetical protein WCB10_01855 [Steroidobacteraceae bacterium]
MSELPTKRWQKPDEFSLSAAVNEAVTYVCGARIHYSDEREGSMPLGRKGTVTTAQKYPNGVTTAQSSNGARAAYNPQTGNAAVAQKNQNGVTTTQTSQGGKAKTKNGMGVAEGPNGTTCAKGQNNQGCKKQ